MSPTFEPLKKEHNARIHFAALLLVLCLSVYCNLAPMEWVAVLIVSGFVLATELLNTAIERIADFKEPQWNHKIGIIKDYAAGAVLIAAVVTVVVGGIVFIPKLIAISNIE